MSSMMLGRSEARESLQCSSSGCQSGWTLYLDHSYNGPLPYKHFQRQHPQLESKEEEEDSMVSDASSGPPPHLCGGDGEKEEKEQHHLSYYSYYSSDQTASSTGSGSHCFGSTRSPSSLGKSKQRRVIEGEDDTRDGDLDDTASSSAVFSCPMRNGSSSIEMLVPADHVLEISTCVFSAKHFKERSPIMHGTRMMSPRMLDNN